MATLVNLRATCQLSHVRIPHAICLRCVRALCNRPLLSHLIRYLAARSDSASSRVEQAAKCPTPEHYPSSFISYSPTGSTRALTISEPPGACQLSCPGNPNSDKEPRPRPSCPRSPHEAMAAMITSLWSWLIGWRLLVGCAHRPGVTVWRWHAVWLRRSVCRVWLRRITLHRRRHLRMAVGRVSTLHGRPCLRSVLAWSAASRWRAVHGIAGRWCATRPARIPTHSRTAHDLRMVVGHWRCTRWHCLCWRCRGSNRGTAERGGELLGS